MNVPARGNVSRATKESPGATMGASWVPLPLHPGTPSDLRRELAALAARSYRPIAVLPPARGVEVARPRTDERTLEIYRNPFLQEVSQGTIVVFERRPDA